MSHFSEHPARCYKQTKAVTEPSIMSMLPGDITVERERPPWQDDVNSNASRNFTNHITAVKVKGNTSA